MWEEDGHLNKILVLPLPTPPPTKMGGYRSVISEWSKIVTLGNLAFGNGGIT